MLEDADAVNKSLGNDYKILLHVLKHRKDNIYFVKLVLILTLKIL